MGRFFLSGCLRIKRYSVILIDKMKTIFLISLFLLSPLLASANMAINEVMYNLPRDSGADKGREWVEIYNNGTESIDLSGWRFYEGGTNHRIKNAVGGSLVVPAGGLAVIADRPEKFIADWPGFSGLLFDSSFSLKNSGEVLVLKDGDLREIDRLEYLSAWGGNGDGNSLQMTNGVWTAASPTPGDLNAGISSVAEEKPASEQAEQTEGNVAEPVAVEKPIPREKSEIASDSEVAPVETEPEIALVKSETESAARESKKNEEAKTEPVAKKKITEKNSKAEEPENKILNDNAAGLGQVPKKEIAEPDTLPNPEMAQTASVVSAISDTVRGANEWLTLVLLLGILAGIGSLFIRG